jgi:Flp pilus assembly protein TadD
LIHFSEGAAVLLDKQGDTEGARTACQRVIDSDDPEGAPRAALNLGILLAEQGDAEGARAAFQQAIDSGHSEIAPMAEDMLNDLNG